LAGGPEVPRFGEPWAPPEGARELGIGVVGAGDVAVHAHLPEYAQAGYRVVAIADVRREAAEAAASRWSLTAYDDHRRLLERKDVDVVLVATPPEPRRAIVEDALAAGKHVLVEKPFAHRYEDAVAMVEAAARAGRRLAVSQNRRWFAAHRAARSLLDAGAVGTPYRFVYTCRDNQEYLVGSWYERYPRFLFIEFAVHHLDLLLYWADREPTVVYATGFRSPVQRFRHPMVSTVTIRFGSEAEAVLLMNDVSEVQRGDGFLIEGGQGLLSSEPGGGLTWTTPDWRLTRWPMAVPSFAASMGSLLEAVLRGTEPPVSAARNLRTVRTYLAAARSAEEGRAVAPEEIARDAAGA
jgi:predicted dehydrogenase